MNPDFFGQNRAAEHVPWVIQGTSVGKAGMLEKELGGPSCLEEVSWVVTKFFGGRGLWLPAVLCLAKAATTAMTDSQLASFPLRLIL